MYPTAGVTLYIKYYCNSFHGEETVAEEISQCKILDYKYTSCILKYYKVNGWKY